MMIRLVNGLVLHVSSSFLKTVKREIRHLAASTERITMPPSPSKQKNIGGKHYAKETNLHNGNGKVPD